MKGPGPMLFRTTWDLEGMVRGLEALALVTGAVKKYPCGEQRCELNCAPNMDGVTTAHTRGGREGP